jgi:hypothetical protein
VHASAGFIEHENGELHNNETDQQSGQRRVEHRPIRIEQIQRRSTNLSHPRDRPLGKPSATTRSNTTCHDLPRHCYANPVRVIDQPAAVVVRSIHHRVPITALIGSDLSHCSALMADLERRPPACPVGGPNTFRRDPNIDERHNLTVEVRATPPRLRPDKTGSPLMQCRWRSRFAAISASHRRLRCSCQLSQPTAS